MHGLSLEAQRDTLTQYAQSHEMKIVDYYADEGVTARKKLAHRKEFQRLLADIQQGKVDLVLVTKLDRWFRNIKDYHNTQDILEKHGCNWKTVLEDYDTSTAAGRLHINIMLSVNQDESDRTSERIKAVFRHKLQQGEIVSGALPVGYGKQDKHLVPNEEADMIRDIYNYYELHNSIRNTIKYVNENYRQLPDCSIRRILTDPIYKGMHKSGVKDFCPAIISEKQWDNVQHLLTMNKKHYKQHGEPSTYIFTGMLRCKECGHRMNGMRRIVGGNIYKQYRCPFHYKEHTCANKYVIPEKGVLEKYLLNNVQAELEKYKVSFEATAAKPKKKDVPGKIAKVSKKLEKLKDLYLEDLIDKETYKKDYEELTAQLEELTAEKQQASVDLSAVNAFLKLDFRQIYDTLNEDEKRYIWQSVIDHIVIGNDRNDIEIHFK